jgi:histone H3/H4
VPLINTIFDHFFPVNPEILAAVSSGERKLTDDVDQSHIGLGHSHYRQIQAIFQEKKSSSGEKETLEEDISAMCQDPAATWVRRLNEVVHEQGRVDPILHLETLEDLFQSHCATDEIHRHGLTHSSVEFSYESMDMVRTFIEGMFCNTIGPTAVELALHADRFYVNASDIKMAWNVTRR